MFLEMLGAFDQRVYTVVYTLCFEEEPVGLFLRNEFLKGGTLLEGALCAIP